MLTMVSVSLLVLTVVFLLVYNLALTAVMLSGNILTTLVSMTILGLGIIVVLAIGLAFCTIYFDTFYVSMLQLDTMAYFSPA